MATVCWCEGSVYLSVMASVCLPSIVQPGCTGDLPSGRGTAPGHGKKSRQRPQTSPESAGSVQGEELVDILAQRVRGGQGSSLRQAFRAFDVKGEGCVTREGLYRILCNILSGVSRKQFNQLLSQLHLESFKTISYEQFCSCLPGFTTRPRPQTTYLPLRGGCGGRSEAVEKMLEHCRKIDTFKSGKLTMDVLRSVLSEFEVPITAEQMNQLCSELGYREGQLVSYTHLISHFTSRGKSGVIHSKLTDKKQRFHSSEPKRACTSVNDAQTRIVSLLNNQFLKLLSAFKAVDRRNSGYVSKAVFRSVLETHSGDSCDVERLAQCLCDGSDLVPYPKFLAMFEHTPSPLTDPPPTPQAHHAPTTLTDSPPTPQAHQPNIDKLVASIRELVTTRSAEVTEVFESLDPANTGRLTVGVARDLLERFGVKCDSVELEGVWGRMLRNRDSTVQFQEFVRYFTSRPITVESRRLTEDHCFMMSKNLHRDEDMILATVRSRLRYHGLALLRQLSQLDQLKTGHLPTHTFLECVSRQCPEISSDQLNLFGQRLGETVAYGTLLSVPQHNRYRHGNNMGCVLAHQSQDCFTSTSPPNVLTARPPYGLSGVKVQLQKQLAKNWRLARRLFREMDKRHRGCVSVGEFWSVLSECGVELSSEDKFTILEYLDPTLQGRVDYGHFISALFEQ